jgi:hypothetical protein
MAHGADAVPALKTRSERERGGYLVDLQGRRNIQQSLNTVIAISVSRSVLDEIREALWQSHVTLTLCKQKPGE